MAKRSDKNGPSINVSVGFGPAPAKPKRGPRIPDEANAFAERKPAEGGLTLSTYLPKKPTGGQ